MSVAATVHGTAPTEQRMPELPPFAPDERYRNVRGCRDGLPVRSCVVQALMGVRRSDDRQWLRGSAAGIASLQATPG
ncbi:hypothetical protein [Stenotrophomonas sp.]|uniref:hypothetical protein n=1 Tax=Stenotrophomonas sp. TaxID=69392 RepID=UPI0028ACCDE1|nr:hypothetical protein [Stenotrophomonas sp.]